MLQVLASVAKRWRQKNFAFPGSFILSEYFLSSSNTGFGAFWAVFICRILHLEFLRQSLERRPTKWGGHINSTPFQSHSNPLRHLSEDYNNCAAAFCLLTSRSHNRPTVALGQLVNIHNRKFSLRLLARARMSMHAAMIERVSWMLCNFSKLGRLI